MIVVLISGGLGNQLFEIVAGLSLQTRLRHALIVDTRFMNEARQPRRYVLPLLLGDFRSTSRVEHFLIRVARWLAHRMRLVSFLRTNPLWSYVVDPDHEGAFSLLDDIRSKFIILEGYWQALQPSEERIDLLRRSLRSIEKLSEAAQQLIRPLSSRTTLAVHIRRGDYVQDKLAFDFHGVCGKEYYDRAARLVEERRTVRSIYVFSDDIEWARENLQFELATTYVSSQKSLTDVEEFLVMTHCHHFCISNSTYSWWAARLSSAPDKIVVAPARWFSFSAASAGPAMPSDWIRL